jgi:tetratricopeptide (TPR) repeat protein
MTAMSHARLRCRSAFVLAFAGMLTVTAAARAGEADDLFDKGNAAYDAGKYEDALAHFGAAWKLRKTHDLAATMAQAEIKLGRYAEACTHLAYALAHFPLTSKVEVKTRMEGALAEAKKNVATLRLQPSVKGAAIKVDGASLDADGAGDSETFVSVGHHVIEATAPGYQLLSVTLDTKAGTSQDVPLNLMPEEKPTQSVSVVPAIALGSGAVVAVGVGIGLVVASTAKGNEATQLRDAYLAAHGTRSCSTLTAALKECNAIGDRLHAQDGLGNAAIGVFAGAGVAAAGALGYWLYARNAAPQNGVRVLPAAGKNGGGLLITGSF